VREALVEDAITGNNLRIKDQTLHISTATDAQDNCRPIPAEWKVENVLDLVKLYLVPSPNRASGSHSTQPTLVRAGPGTGKTWMAKQAVYTLADRLLRGSGSNDGIRLVPIVVFVQRIIYLLREVESKNSQYVERRKSLLERYIESVYSGKKLEAWCTMLMQAYDMRALVVLLDGVDEAAGLRDQIEEFVHKEVVPSGNRVLVTSRPEGVRLETYSKT
jgi:predicted NACHT family NTPase